MLYPHLPPTPAYVPKLELRTDLTDAERAELASQLQELRASLDLNPRPTVVYPVLTPSPTVLAPYRRMRRRHRKAAANCWRDVAFNGRWRNHGWPDLYRRLINLPYRHV